MSLQGQTYEYEMYIHFFFINISFTHHIEISECISIESNPSRAHFLSNCSSNSTPLSLDKLIIIICKYYAAKNSDERQIKTIIYSVFTISYWK